MAALADKIKATGRTAGLWLAPLIVTPNLALFREHPDWLLRDERGELVKTGLNWTGQTYALDVTHPAVLDWLGKLIRKVVGWGYGYLKLDFLYAGAAAGKSEEHTSELQSPTNLVCRLLLEKKNISDTSSFKFRRSKGSIGHAFTVRIRTGNQNQTSFYPFVPHEISVLEIGR